MGLMIGDSGTKINKLWENKNADVAFSAQKISIDLSKYDAVLVECTFKKNYSQRRCELIRVGTIFTMEVTNKDDKCPGGFRVITVDSEGVTFAEGYTYFWDTKSYVADDGGAVPTFIYGVKF